MDNKKNRKIYRQGDVLLYEVFDDDIFDNYGSRSGKRFLLIGTESKVREYIVREGETGNKHILVADEDFLVMSGRDCEIHQDVKIIKLLSDAVLKHEEHNQLLINKGMYAVIFEREYDYFKDEWRWIKD